MEEKNAERLETKQTSRVSDVEAARLLGCAPQTLRRWRHERRGPVYFKIGSLVRYDVNSLEEFASARIVQPSEVA